MKHIRPAKILCKNQKEFLTLNKIFKVELHHELLDESIRDTSGVYIILKENNTNEWCRVECDDCEGYCDGYAELKASNFLRKEKLERIVNG